MVALVTKHLSMKKNKIKIASYYKQIKTIFFLLHCKTKEKTENLKHD